MKRARSPRLFVPLLLLLAVSLLALGSLAACGDATVEPEPFAALRDSVDRYLKPFKGGNGVKVYRDGDGRAQGYLRGDVVLLEGKRLSGFHSHLPRSLRASTPDRVGTVVVIKESWRKVGEYSNGEPALLDVWRITVVDLARGRAVGRALLLGSRPPYMADTSMAQNYGDPPWRELLAYLKKLPQRKQ